METSSKTGVCFYAWRRRGVNESRRPSLAAASPKASAVGVARLCLFLRPERVGAGRQRALLEAFARHDLALRRDDARIHTRPADLAREAAVLDLRAAIH